MLLAGRQTHAQELLQTRFKETIGDASSRLIFLRWQPFDDYCRLLMLADVVLDPLHFGAGSSSYDVFSFNQPAVTMPGELIVGRVAYAFYQKMGFEDVVASTPQEYIRLALRLGTDRGFRTAMKRQLAAASDAVFDDLQAVREHERFFEEALG